jgi:hypothetical protein
MKTIMQSPITEFRKALDDSNQVFMAWDAQYTIQRQVFADVAKRRHEKIKTIPLDHRWITYDLHM